MLKAGLLTRSKETVKCSQSPETPSVTRRTIDIQTLTVLFAHIAKGLLQKKVVSPIVVNCFQGELKYVKDVSINCLLSNL